MKYHTCPTCKKLYTHSGCGSNCRYKAIWCGVCLDEDSSPNPDNYFTDEEYIDEFQYYCDSVLKGSH